MNWNGIQGSGYNPITPDERSLRVQLCKYEGQHYLFMGIPGREYGPNELCKTFLNLNPTPNIVELVKALHPIGTFANYYDSYKHRYNHYIADPDPDRPHYADRFNLKRGDRTLIPHPKRKGFFTWKRVPLLKSEYVKTLKQEMILRRQYMKEIIESRGQTVPNNKKKELLVPAWFITMWGDSFQYHPEELVNFIS